MKDKLKNLLKSKTFIGCTAGVLVVAIVITAILLLPDKKAEPVTEPDTTSSVSDTESVPDIKEPETSDTESEETEEIPSDISVDVGENTEDKNADVQTGGKADTPAKPVTVKEPEKPADTDSGSGGGIIIGDGGDTAEYSCGCANHHCKNAEAHAYIQNLELEGCPTCGSHSCPSFYGTDAWGNTGYFPTLCPKYNEKSDPLHYCQKCGKKTGDGSGGTCVEFINASNCPLCGEYVEARSCHTCK